jgi:hypothetical protein
MNSIRHKMDYITGSSISQPQLYIVYYYLTEVPDYARSRVPSGS